MAYATPKLKKGAEPVYDASVGGPQKVVLYEQVHKADAGHVVSSLADLTVKSPSSSASLPVPAPTATGYPSENDANVESMYAKPVRKTQASADGSPPKGTVGRRPPMPVPVQPAASAAPNSVVLSGIRNYAKFLNGVYRRIDQTLHGERPCFRIESPLPPGIGPAAGKVAYLYFHEDNKAWVIGMRLGSSGVAAYRVGSEDWPSISNGKSWFVSDDKGKFSQEPSATCVAGDGAPLPAEVDMGSLPKPADAATSMLPSGTSRNKAETLLTDVGKPGAFVVRESTSMPDAYVLSVLMADAKQVMHYRVERQPPNGYVISGSSMQHKTLSALIKYYSKNNIPGSSIMLGKCCSGEELYESLP